MRPSACLGDLVVCYCIGAFGNPCSPGFIVTASTRTIISNRPAARVGDICTNCAIGACLSPNPILTGSTKTLINNRPAAYLGSIVRCGVVSSSTSKVLI